MKLIIISDNGSQHRKFNLNVWIISALLIAIILLAIAFLSSASKTKKVFTSKHDVEMLNKFDSILLQAAKLEGQVKRLNSLGKVIAEKNKIDIKSYLLSNSPAMGGLEKTTMTGISYPLSKITHANLTQSINDLELKLDLEQQRFDIMTKAVTPPPVSLKKKIFKQKATKPAYSIPVSAGYISSTYGKRRDPINGHQRHHNGIDIAAKHGSRIHTIASGFVTFAGRKGGYGNVIDIHHSDSLKSRYAHLAVIKVKKGDVVRKGDIIATMGKTGRATGSHLHLEVWEKNKVVNPGAYIDTALIK